MVDENRSADAALEERLEVLLDRDGTPDGADWARLRELAVGGPDGAARVIDVLRDRASLGAAVEARVADADAVALAAAEIGRASASAAGAMHATPRREGAAARARAGWLAAAAVLLAWIAVEFTSPVAPERRVDDERAIARPIVDPRVGPGDPTAAPADVIPPAPGVASGPQVVEVLPAMVVETRMLPDGGVEVFYLERRLERRVIDSVFELSRDELGFAVPVRSSPAVLARSDLL